MALSVNQKLNLRTLALDGHQVVLSNSAELLTLAPDQAGVIEVSGGKAADITGLTPGSFSSSNPDVATAVLRPKTSSRAEIHLQAKKPAAGKLTKTTMSGALSLSCTLHVGKHQSHFGDAVDNKTAFDLLAQVSNGNDLRTIVAIQQILHNEQEGIIDQLKGRYSPANSNTLACGDVVRQAGLALFGKTTGVESYHSYHVSIKKPPSKLQWADIKYAPKTTAKAITAINASLKEGAAVRVGTVYQPDSGMVALSNGALQPNLHGGHFVLIVASLKGKFLYLDPWPGGSITKYEGGLPFNKGQACQYMGVFEVMTDAARGTFLGKSATCGGTFKQFEVITGPL